MTATTHQRLCSDLPLGERLLPEEGLLAEEPPPLEERLLLEERLPSDEG